MGFGSCRDPFVFLRQIPLSETVPVERAVMIALYVPSEQGRAASVERSARSEYQNEKELHESEALFLWRMLAKNAIILLIALGDVFPRK